MVTWFAGNMIKFDGNLLENKMSNIVVHEAYELGKEAYESGKDLHSLDLSNLTTYEQEMVEKGYYDAGSSTDDEDMEDDMNLYNDDEPQELNFD